jgi:hypothetical protein
VYSRLDYGAALTVRPDRALDRVDDLRAGEAEASDIRARQES